MTCSHLYGMWDWRPPAFTRSAAPAYAVYCTDCKTLLFTIIYDADAKEHRVGCPNYHLNEWREYIRKAIRQRFPYDRVVIANAAADLRRKENNGHEEKRG